MSEGRGHDAHISAAVAIAAEAEIGEFWGCNIDAASVTWLQENLDPPFRAVPSGALRRCPSTTAPSTWCTASRSSATSLTNGPHGSWSSAWCSGTTASLIATFMGEGMSESIAGEPWDENRIGMNTLRYGQPWDLGGPMVLRSPWWIRLPATFGTAPARCFAIAANQDITLQKVKVIGDRNRVLFGVYEVQR